MNDVVSILAPQISVSSQKGVKLDFQLSTQEKDFWCWAAVTLSLENYFRSSRAEAVSSQSDVANRHVQGRSGNGRNTPQPNGSALKERTRPNNKSCTVNACMRSVEASHSLRALLQELNLLAEVLKPAEVKTEAAPGGENGVDDAKAKLEQIKKCIISEIENRRPVPCRIGWNKDGNGHFVCLYGYTMAENSALRIFVFDPLFPGMNRGQAQEVSMSFDSFLEQYNLGGQFGRVTHIYTLKSGLAP